MLLKITDSCRMGCSHCSESCTPEGTHMNWETFTQSIEFIKSINPLSLLITGGEPTDHPHFYDFMKHLLNEISAMQTKVIVTSNGMFLDDDSYAEKILSLNCDFQITNDRRYYPRDVKIINHSRVIYEHRIRHVCLIGRAKENGIEHGERNGMKCFNIRAMSRQMGSLQSAIKYLELTGKGFCVPSIDVNGNIKPGEFSLCKTMGNVWNSIDDIYLTIKKMELSDCNQCGDVKYLSPKIVTAFNDLSSLI